jgi:hypothetical protein
MSRKHHKKDQEQIFDQFLGDDNEDEMPLEEYASQVKRNPLLNPSLISKLELDEIQEGMTNASRHPASLVPLFGNATTEAKTTTKYVDSLNVDVLFTQIGAKGTKRGFVMHNFDPSSTHRARLFEWPIFGRVTELLMGPLFYLKTIGSATQQKSKMNKQVEFQHNLALSESLQIMSLMQSLEEQLGAIMVKLVMRGNALVLLFEWAEDKAFLFFISFCILKGGGIGGEDTVALHRSDLFMDYIVEEEESEEEKDFFGKKVAKKTVADNSKAKQAEFISFSGTAVTFSFVERLKAMLLTFVNYGYTRRIEPEEAPLF